MRFRSNRLLSVRRNGYGCDDDMSCGCGCYGCIACMGVMSNPKGKQHRELMRLTRVPHVTEQDVRSMAEQEAISEYLAERSRG